MNSENESLRKDGLTSALEDVIEQDLLDPHKLLRPEKKSSNHTPKSPYIDANFDQNLETQKANAEMMEFFDPVDQVLAGQNDMEDLFKDRPQKAREMDVNEISFSSEDDFHLDLNSQEKSTRKKTKSSLRMTYEAEKKVIINKIGDLESIRKNLGLSKRKICQLLMVDPSAWTRWEKSGGAPPNIYRSLEWYVALNDKYPQMGNAFWLNHTSNSTSKKNTEEIKKDLEKELGFSMRYEMEKTMHGMRLELQDELKRRIDKNFEAIPQTLEQKSRNNYILYALLVNIVLILVLFFK